MAAAATLVLVGCAAAPQLTPQTSGAGVIGSPSASASPTRSEAVFGNPPKASASPPTPTASSPTGVTSTSISARVGPKGSIRDEMYAVAYHPVNITVRSGTVSIFLVNPAGKSLSGHAMVIGTAVHQTITASGYVSIGQSAVFTVRGLPPGTYVFWCPVDNHADEGMVGTLTIR
jgi:plastocyanin